MNPYFYVFYKLSNLLNKKGNNKRGPINALTLLVLIDICFIYIKVFDISQSNAKEIYKIGIIIISISLFLINNYLFLYNDRYREIQAKYSKEGIKQKKIGSILVIFYVIVTFGTLFFI